jgi:hypothetical protein
VAGVSALSLGEDVALGGAAATLDLQDLNEVTFEGAVTAGAAGDTLTVESSASDVAMNLAAGAVSSNIELDDNISSLTLNVGTAVAGADATVDTLTNAADTDGNTESLETLTLVNVRDDNETGQDYSITLGDGAGAELNGLTTINLSGAGQQEASYDNTQAIAAGDTDSVTLVATDAGFAGPVTIQIGEAELNYDNDAGDLRETFQFVGDEISNVEIGTRGAAEFTVTAAGNGDKLDFSQFDGVDSLNDLSITSDANDYFIAAADGQFEGVVTLAGVADVEQSVLEANGFIF